MRVLALIVLAVLVSYGRDVRAADGVSAEDVKAAFVVRFPAYTDWPPEALQAPQFTIAVLGDDLMAARLEMAVAGRRIKDRPVRVQRVVAGDPVGDAQVLYIGAVPQAQLRRALAAVEGHSTLVVTSDERGLEAGAAVNFLLADRRVRFEISQLAAEHSGLRISSELLSVAVRVLRRTGSP